MRALLQDQLIGAGVKASLWLSVHDVRDGDAVATGTMKCTCVKASGQHADRRCLSCHGINFIPGYRKFGHETLWAASVSPGLTLTDLQLNTVLKPNRLELSATATTGTAETGDLFFTKLIAGAVWEWKLDGIVKDGAASSMVAHFSTNGGATWTPMAGLAAANPATGRIRFRVTLQRDSTAIASPSWEILRTRFATIPLVDRFGPWILVLKSISSDKEIQDVRGVTIDSTSNSFWTAPLSLFDCSVMGQTNVDSTFDEGDTIRDPAFIEFLEGTRNANHSQRWTLTNFTFSDPLGYLVRQFFQARLAQHEEFTSLVW